MNSLIKNTVVILVMALIGGCGGGSDAFVSSSTATTSGSGSTGDLNVSLSLTDSGGTATTSISADSPGTLKATVTDSTGSAVSGAVVVFTTTLATFNPTSGSALTNSSGVATVTLIAGTTTGADTISADVTANGVSASATMGYTVSAPSVSLSSLSVGASPLSALGTTSLSITVLDGNGSPYSTPVDVSFSSVCSASGKATISSPITTVAGVATSNYVDQGCANTDTITASLTLGGTTLSKTATIVVNPASAGSIQFVSATPTNIALKGTGGAGLQENSTVKFKVVNASGTAVPSVSVDFTLSTAVGGITMGPTTAISDASGEVSTVVNSGTVATAVRVFATVTGSNPVLTTQSDQMTITTGIPSQDHISLSSDQLNMEGWDYNNECATLTVNVSDHFGNPAPDGTAINFTAEGGQVGADCGLCGNPAYCESGGACHTVNGICRVAFVSADPRPTNGRVTILAYGIGEEGFTDMDGDGYVSSNAERVDTNGVSTDMSEAWLDSDEDGVRDADEPFIDFGGAVGSFDAGDGLYNGVLCQAGAAWCDPAVKNINVRKSAVIVFSGSTAVIKATTSDPTANPDVFNTSPVGTLALDSCVTGSAWQATDSPTVVYLQITDERGNALDGGTTVSASTTNGTIILSPVSTLSDTTECVSGDSAYTGCPKTAPHDVTNVNLTALTIVSDATQSGTSAPYTCSNTSSFGYLTITVSTPKGNDTSLVIPVSD